ncbi:MAG: hypothetical protein ACI9R3_005956 [Verrucomicrobiales bacterium]|jgi:hypothetical protein
MQQLSNSVAFEDRRLELIDGNLVVCNDLDLSPPWSIGA